MEITISGKDKKLLQQVEALAQHLGLKIYKPLKKEKRQKKANGEELHKLMKEAASRGDLFKSIPEPVEWQREQRKDRILYGREE
jgi:hypothetical protein